jgi:adenylate cyclase
VSKRARLRVALFIGVGLLSAAIGLAAYAGHLLRSFESQTVDARFSIRNSTQGTKVPSDLVVVQIDAHTFSAFNNSGLGKNGGSQWPFSRRYHARVIQRVAAGHPKAIAYDVQFTERSKDPTADEDLATAVWKAGHVVLATTEVGPHGSTNVFGGDAVVKQIGAHVGNGLVPADPDGVIRHMQFQIDELRTLGLVTADVVAGHKIKTPSGNQAWIDFAGPPGTVKTYSFSDVMFGKVPPSAFTNKIVIIGPSAPTLQDIHATAASGSDWMSGAEIQGNAAETALHDFPLRSVSTPIDLLLVVLLAMIAPLAALRLSGWLPSALALVAGAVYAVVVQFAFDHGKVLLFAYPIGALVVSLIGTLAVHYLLEAFERSRTRAVFSRFVPEAVVGQVLERAGGELRLGGEQVYGTVLFTDLRGFTTFSEKLEAAEVIDLLNRYLARMTDVVLAHGGTLMSFTGDGFMAVFGAPLEQEDHADRAVEAALEMLEVHLPSFNEWLSGEGFEKGFKMGIGINTGPFMAGNVGSEQRLEYTAIGDTINTASRIEGMTKGTPYALFLADATRDALVRPPAELAEVGEMPVRGRSQPIKLWSIQKPAVLKENWESEVAAKDAAPAAAPVAVSS